ncbi:hypothetical protein NPIL_556941 [Nephila pilipes]|uniref:Uncharacterized protein n=1 Tax=Nephila pilipes TaxID=299642 RepID=A0A8X6PDV7_NEPPI|nr:hypothetical protein NPIL_556941 [Nephila pilipes]
MRRSLPLIRGALSRSLTSPETNCAGILRSGRLTYPVAQIAYKKVSATDDAASIACGAGEELFPSSLTSALDPNNGLHETTLPLRMDSPYPPPPLLSLYHPSSSEGAVLLGFEFSFRGESSRILVHRPGFARILAPGAARTAPISGAVHEMLMDGGGMRGREEDTKLGRSAPGAVPAEARAWPSTWATPRLK